VNPGQLLTHFDRISEAPDAIPRLRRFILDLAVRGKLVEQDPREEPAAQLLNRIRTEKARLVKEGKVGKQNLQTEIEPDAIHLTLPQGWEWARLGNLIHLVSGQHLQPDEYSNEKKQNWPPYITGPADFGQNGLVITRYAVVRKAVAKKGQILLTVKGAGIGKTAICDLTEVAISRQIMAMTAIQWSQRFLLLITHRLAESLKESARSLIPGISREDVEQFTFALPPLAEQHRIGVKVDELMALCDRLEAAQAERESRRDRLAVTVHASLSNSSFTTLNSTFFINHLPRLTTKPEHIQQLRQTILNLAVRGKLVPQNPNDEPAFELLKRIQAVKARLAEEGELKKDKNAWVGLPEEPPHQLPPNWSWTCLQDVFEISRGGSPRPAGDPRYFGGAIPWITVREVTKDRDKYLTSTKGGLTEEGATRSRFIDPGDLLLTNSGATLGVPKISRIRACMNDGVAVLRLFHSVPLNDFAYLYLHSQTHMFRQVNQGMGQPNLNTPIIAGWFFPLPPLAEQHRIVAKVDELMALCDQLEAQLTTSQTESRRFLESVLHAGLVGKRERMDTKLDN
jgi:type I restriction enzyme S subunit